MPQLGTGQADAAQNAIIVPSTTYYLSLHTGDPGATGASEGTDGRQSIAFASSSGGTQASNTAQSWSSAQGGKTYTYFGVWSAATGGTYRRGGTLSSITPPAGAIISVASGGITFTAS